jgi:hypothetical protein
MVMNHEKRFDGETNGNEGIEKHTLQKDFHIMPNAQELSHRLLVM